MIERYSLAARRAVDLAGVEARRLGHPHVGTEHLLLGLLAEGHNPASRLLQGAGAPLSACREKVSEALARRDLPAPARCGAELELTDRASRAMDRAGKLSLRMKSEEVRTSHLMISVLDVEGTAGQVLRGLNVDLGALYEELSVAATRPDTADAPSPRAEAAGQGSDESAAPDATAAHDATAVHAAAVDAHAGAEPVCATCGKPLQATLASTVVASAAGGDYEVVFCSSCGAGLGARRLG